MTVYEYKVVPAPKRGLKAKGLRTSEARFANALSAVMNEMGVDGWEYQRTDTLPCEERQGLTGRTTVFQNMLVFRRAKEEPVEAYAPKEVELAPVVAAPVAAPKPDETRTETVEDRVQATLDAGQTEEIPNAPAPAPEDATFKSERVAAE